MLRIACLMKLGDSFVLTEARAGLAVAVEGGGEDSLGIGPSGQHRRLGGPHPGVVTRR